MTGYTGNANTPPSVMNKMFNIGVLGQTPAFRSGSGRIWAQTTFGSRDAQPEHVGSWRFRWWPSFRPSECDLTQMEQPQ